MDAAARAAAGSDPSTTVRAIVRRHGWNTTSYEILNPGSVSEPIRLDTH
jgi:hypothetical protein